MNLSEYEASRTAFTKANPYKGDTSQYYGVDALVGGWGSESAMAATNRPQDEWVDTTHQNWLGTLTPEQRAEYKSLVHDKYQKTKKMHQMGFLAAAGAMAAPGILGAFGAEGGSAAGAYGAGSGWGADTLSAMGLGADSYAATGLGAIAYPLGESTLPVFTDLGAEAMGGLGTGVAGSGAGGSASIPGLDGYYSGLGGVDGSLISGGVNNPGFASWYQSIPKGTLSKLIDIFGGADSLIKGLYSLYQSNKFSDLGKGTPSQQTANAQLDALLKDPSQIYKMPGWEAGLQAVERTGAGQGYLGSGNMMIALNKYGGDFYNNTVRQLNDIATGGQNVQAGYNVGAANLFGQGANSLGYWMSKFGKPVFDMIGG